MSVLGQSPAGELELPSSAYEGAGSRPAQSYWNESWERLRDNRIGVAAGVLILILAAIALAAPLFTQFLTHYEPYRLDLLSTFQSPGRPHLLGTDELGRDTLTRLIYGGRVTLGVAFLTVALSLSLGTTVGLLAGYYGRWISCSARTRSPWRQSSPPSVGAASRGWCGARCCRSSSATS